MFQDSEANERATIATCLSPILAWLKPLAARDGRRSFVEPCERLAADTGLYVLDDIACVRIRRR